MKLNLSAITGNLKLKEYFSFGLLSINGYMLMVNTYLMIFYTDVVGLDPAAIATLFLVTRVADGLNDPIMGYVVDHLPRTKLGRFRGYLLIGTAICTLNYFLLWFGPAWASTGKLAIAYASYILFGITYDMMQIPNASLLPSITADQKDRAMLSTFKGSVALINSLIYGMIPPMIIQMMGDAKLSAYYIIIFGAMTLAMICTTTGVLGIRERVEPVDDEKYKFREIFSILTQRPVFFTTLLMMMFATSASAASASSMYFFTYMLDGRFDVISISSIFSTISVVPTVLLAGWLVQKFGKKRLMLALLVVYALGFAIRLINVTSIPLFYASVLINGFPLGIFNVVSPTIQADNIDYVEYKLNRRAEAGISSLDSFVIKSSHGIGGAIGGYVLSSTGYVANQPQTDLAKFGIVFNTIWMPIITYIIGLFVFGFGYNLNSKKVAEVNETLLQRREAKNSDS